MPSGRAPSAVSIPIGGAPAASREENRLLLATVTLRIPDQTWTGPFSRRHPREQLEILGRSESGRGSMVADHWISGRPAGVWAREIASFSDVLAVESLAEVGDGSLYRVQFRTPPIVDLYRRLEVPIPFPVRIRAGHVQWEVVARAPDFAEILAFGRRVDPHLRIRWTRTPPLRSHLPLLTPKQRELLHRAIAAGYFAVPRRIRLGDLARELNRGKATVSESLARIEQKLLESALRNTLARPE
jgi:hypothetical protein